MSQLSNSPYEWNMTGLLLDSVIEYYITATDAFDKTTESMNGTEYYSFIVGSAPSTTSTGDSGALMGTILIAVVILAIGVIMLVYMFVIKKK